MPDRTRIRVGDRIRILCVPTTDLEQRERELQEGLPDAGHTADTIEQIITTCPEVVIYEIDEYDLPWYEVELYDENHQPVYHFLAILDDDSWEYC
jgi:hypothetical protein